MSGETRCKCICGECYYKTGHCKTGDCLYAHKPSPSPAAEPLCVDCGHPKDDSRFHLEAPGDNWGAALHSFKPGPAAEPTRKCEVCSGYGCAYCFGTGKLPGPASVRGEQPDADERPEDKWAELCSAIGLDPWETEAEQIVDLLRKKAQQRAEVRAPRPQCPKCGNEEKIYNSDGEWVGVEIRQTMTREEAKRRYPYLDIEDERND